MKEQDIVILLKDMMKNKDPVIMEIAKSIDQSTRIQKGLSKAKESVIENPSEANLRKMINVTMNSLETQSKFINQLAIISLVYVTGGNYTSDIAKSLLRLGHGEDALREMFKQKMQG